MVQDTVLVALPASKLVEFPPGVTPIFNSPVHAVKVDGATCGRGRRETLLADPITEYNLRRA